MSSRKRPSSDANANSDYSKILIGTVPDLIVNLARRQAANKDSTIKPIGGKCLRSFMRIKIGEYERDVNRNIHKYNAYRKAAAAVGSHPTRLSSGEEAKKLPGVGVKIAEKLDEIITTGKLKKLEKIHNDEFSTAVKELAQVSGIGPVKAQELVKSGIKTVEELRKHTNGLTHHQLIGLRYDFQMIM